MQNLDLLRIFAFSSSIQLVQATAVNQSFRQKAAAMRFITTSNKLLQSAER
jgi:hypothetical protein